MADLVAAHAALQVYNTLNDRLEPFQPLVPGKVSMYVCGPTVYDDPHLGHARCYLTWDVVYRVLRFLGFTVTYVRNVTDVDDKILNRSASVGCTPEALAHQYYQRFDEAMALLNVLKPTHEPRATEFIPQMQEGIQVLLEKQMAYLTTDGTVYYRTRQKQDYGKLSKKPLDDLQSGARVDVDNQKENPLDFALWKGVADTDPHAWSVAWDAQHRGRPGWHMECSAMSRHYLGDQLDIHAGGADLIFPHHENEIAQSEAWTGKTPFVRYWLHNGFVNVSGEKMSKSLGNFETIHRLLEAYSANAVRYFLLTHHYRMPVDFTAEALTAAENRVVKVMRTLKRMSERLGLDLATWDTLPESLQKLDILGDPLMQTFVEALAHDFNTPQALAILNAEVLPVCNHLVNEENFQSEAAQRQLTILLAMLSLLGFSVVVEDASASLPQEALQALCLQLALQPENGVDSSSEDLLHILLEARKQAKQEKNWGVADQIRNGLSELGIQLKDNKDGTTAWEVTPSALSLSRS